jgi:2-polyprenyl-3-methyl-5-hydroxy-6-metoxy-1,4-benzoquinol methylase
MLKRAVLSVLGRLGILAPSFRVFELLKAVGFRGQAVETREGLPVPPPRLRVRVAGTADVAWFLESGRLTAATIRDALLRQGLDLTPGRAVLDFGCGCGRVIRHFADLGLELHGSDQDGELVRWCAHNLTFATFLPNGLAPPSEYDDESFDVVYAVSVLTHLPEDLQLAWMSELRRVLRPAGMLVVTTHGDAYAERLTPSERAAYEAGDVVVRWSSAAATNLCTAFHPEGYVRDRLACELDLAEFVPQGAEGTPDQDLVVLRRPGPSASAQRPSSRSGPAASPSG